MRLIEDYLTACTTQQAESSFEKSFHVWVPGAMDKCHSHVRALPLSGLVYIKIDKIEHHLIATAPSPGLDGT